LRTAATAVAAADEEEKDKRDGERVNELEDERRRGLGILFPPFLSFSQLTLLLLLLLRLFLRFPTSTAHPSTELLLRIFKAARHHPLAAATPAHLRLFLLLSVTLCYTHNAAAATCIIMIILNAAGCLWHPRQAQEEGKL
jgi:uncharacterized membrane protein YqjE